MSTAVKACTRLVEAPWVLPISRPAIEDGAVLLDEHGVVLAVGTRRELRAQAPGGTERVFGGAVVLPSFANAHLHLELSALRGAIPGGAGLVAWVRALIAKRAALDEATVRGAMHEALDELRASGTSVLGDIASGLAGNELPDDAPFEGVRFHEALAAQPADASRALDEARARAARGNGPLRAALAAHAPATCSEELLRAIAAIEGPVSIHLAEDPAERQLLAKGEGPWADLLRERAGIEVYIPQGISPSLCTARANLLGPRTLAVHCVDVDDDDVALLARSGATAVLCPRSNRFLGLPAAPVAKLLAAGIPLALGTDSLASAPSLSVLEEAAALSLAPEVALAAATRGGARALGLAHRGVIEPGARPGLIALDAVVARRRPEAAILEQPRSPLVWL